MFLIGIYEKTSMTDAQKLAYQAEQQAQDKQARSSKADQESQSDLYTL